jgi:hypothetical protein
MLYYYKIFVAEGIEMNYTVQEPWYVAYYPDNINILFEISDLPIGTKEWFDALAELQYDYDNNWEMEFVD